MITCDSGDGFCWSGSEIIREEQDRSIHGPVIEEIKFLLQSVGDVSVRAVRRTSNEAAHLMAKEGCENKTCNSWSAVAPMCILNRLE
jgi:hypothetical protein